MGLINLRDLIQFPSNGDNSTDSVINGVHFNTTALTHWNYTLFSNNTLSNGSSCYLIFDNYKPVILANGTFINGTSCYSPILPLETRGRLGAIFGALFGISIMFTLINLKKHGQTYLREDKRFRIVGRRWQWYWMLFVGGCGIISSITAIDVDRDYLQDLALVLQSLFFYCIGQAGVAAVWEGVRHWGSWQERQIVDADPFTLRQDDTRGKIEFYMPLLFYLFAFMSFFMTVPRSWTHVTDQGGIVQQMTVAKPIATDGRFKAGSIFLCIAWLIIVYCIRHNLHYYRPYRRTPSSLFKLILREFPINLTLGLIAIGVNVGYTAAAAWNFNISIMKYDVAVVYPYAFGYAPCVVLLIIFNVWGYIDLNEDKALIQQRISRGRDADAILGLTKKPNWWSKARGDHHLDDLQRLQGMVADTNIHSNQENDNNRTTSDAVELTNMRGSGAQASANSAFGASNTLRDRSQSRGGLSPRQTNADSDSGLLTPRRSDRLARTPSDNSLASAMTGNTLNGENVQNRSQTVRSMLDV